MKNSLKQTWVVEELASALASACQSRDVAEKAEGWAYDELCVLMRFILGKGLHRDLVILVNKQDWNDNRKTGILGFIENTVESGEFL